MCTMVEDQLTLTVSAAPAAKTYVARARGGTCVLPTVPLAAYSRSPEHKKCHFSAPSNRGCPARTQTKTTTVVKHEEKEGYHA